MYYYQMKMMRKKIALKFLLTIKYDCDQIWADVEECQTNIYYRIEEHPSACVQ